MKIKSICVYCASQPGNDPEFMECGRKLGKSMAHSGVTLVYGGGSRGIMGAVSDAVKENGGKVRGVIPEFLLEMEGEGKITAEDPNLTVVHSMHERKQKMFELSDAFVALPGGLGTLEEIIEIMTWAQLGRHEKPIAFLNAKQFWHPLMNMIESMKQSGFIHKANLVKPKLLDDPELVVQQLSS